MRSRYRGPKSLNDIHRGAWKQAEEESTGKLQELHGKTIIIGAAATEKVGTRAGGLYAGWEASNSIAQSMDGASPATAWGVRLVGTVGGGLVGNHDLSRALGAGAVYIGSIPTGIAAGVADMSWNKASSILGGDEPAEDVEDTAAETYEDDELMPDGGILIPEEDYEQHQLAEYGEIIEPDGAVGASEDMSYAAVPSDAYEAVMLSDTTYEE